MEGPNYHKCFRPSDLGACRFRHRNGKIMDGPASRRRVRAHSDPVNLPPGNKKILDDRIRAERDRVEKEMARLGQKLGDALKTCLVCDEETIDLSPEIVRRGWVKTDIGWVCDKCFAELTDEFTKEPEDGPEADRRDPVAEDRQDAGGGVYGVRHGQQPGVQPTRKGPPGGPGAPPQGQPRTGKGTRRQGGR